MYDRVGFNRTRKGQLEKVKVPIFYSDTGSEQFNQDYFLNTDRYDYCKELDPTIEGNVRVVPSGVVKLNSVGLENSDLSNPFQFTKFYYDRKGEFGTQRDYFAAKTKNIPLLLDFECTIKTASDLDRMRVFQSIVRVLHKSLKFTVSHEGNDGIFCIASFPESYSMPKNFQFNKSDDNSRPIIEFPIEVRTIMYDRDYSTARYNDNNLKNGLTEKRGLG